MPQCVQQLRTDVVASMLLDRWRRGSRHTGFAASVSLNKCFLEWASRPPHIGVAAPGTLEELPVACTLVRF